jgi:hypothetical protein
MTSHRKSSLILTLLAVLMTVAPASAFGNSLLSGYGGPGEGNQAILGSALLGGGGAGGGSGSSGGSSGLRGSSSTDAGVGGQTGGQAGDQNATLTGSRGQGSTAHGRGVGVAGSRGERGEASGGGALAYPVSSGDNPSRVASVAANAFGLSGGDLVYVLLVLGALAVTGVVTGRLARMSRPEGL